MTFITSCSIIQGSALGLQGGKGTGHEILWPSSGVLCLEPGNIGPLLRRRRSPVTPWILACVGMMTMRYWAAGLTTLGIAAGQEGYLDSPLRISNIDPSPRWFRF